MEMGNGIFGNRHKPAWTLKYFGFTILVGTSIFKFLLIHIFDFKIFVLDPFSNSVLSVQTDAFLSTTPFLPKKKKSLQNQKRTTYVHFDKVLTCCLYVR